MPTCGVEVIVFQDLQVLFVKRADFPVWSLPGGAIEPHESPEDAAVREILEETGLAIRLTRFAGFYSRPRWRFGGDVCLVYEGRVVSGQCRPGEETAAAAFFSDDHWPYGLLPWYPLIIAHTLAGATEPFVYSFDTRWPFQSDHTHEIRQELARRLDQADEAAVTQFILDQTPLNAFQPLVTGLGS